MIKFKIGDRVLVFKARKYLRNSEKLKTGVIEDIDRSGTIYVEMDNYKNNQGQPYQEIFRDEYDLLPDTPMNRLLYG